MTPKTLVLFGDSILDNAPYTGGAPDSTAHLRRLLPDWNVDRHARDGAVMSDIPHQVKQLKARPAVAVLSVGGNDVVRHIGILEPRQANTSDLLRQLLRIADVFEEEYERVARAVAEHADRTVLCTIYEVELEPRAYAELARVPLSMLNDRIVRTASRLGIDVLELRSVCTTPADFVMQIEPSAQGAEKIANAIAAVVGEAGGASGARVFSTRGEQ
jgi:lysophospholipase L1-like esterase